MARRAREPRRRSIPRGHSKPVADMGVIGANSVKTQQHTQQRRGLASSRFDLSPLSFCNFLGTASLCVLRLKQERGLSPYCRWIDDIGAAVAIAGCDEC